MRKFLLLFILGLSAAVSLYADDEIPLEPIPGSELTGQTGTTHRAPEYVPLSACYDRLTSSVCLTFLRDLGEVEVSVTNLNNADSAEFNITSAIGSVILPVNAASGTYILNILLSNGKSYEGVFDIE